MPSATTGSYCRHAHTRPRNQSESGILIRSANSRRETSKWSIFPCFLYRMADIITAKTNTDTNTEQITNIRDFHFKIKCIKIHVSQEAARRYSYFHLYMCVFSYLCVSRLWPNEKRYRPEIWYKHSTRPYLKTGFLFFRKIDPEDR